jgi:hypothetical protein
MKELSECCQKPVKVISRRGIMGCDCYYVCEGCSQPCDIIGEEGEGDDNDSGSRNTRK